MQSKEHRFGVILLSLAQKFQIPVHESFWMQNLKERIGSRMYERLIEVSEFIDFTNLPSYRRVLGRDF